MSRNFFLFLGILLLTLTTLANAAPRYIGGTAGTTPVVPKEQAPENPHVPGVKGATDGVSNVNNMTADSIAARRRINSGFYVRGTVKKGSILVPADANGTKVVALRLENKLEEMRLEAKAQTQREETNRILQVAIVGSANGKEERRAAFAAAAQISEMIAELPPPETAGKTAEQLEAEKEYRDYLERMLLTHNIAVGSMKEAHYELLASEGLVPNRVTATAVTDPNRSPSQTTRATREVVVPVTSNTINWLLLGAIGIVIIGIAPLTWTAYKAAFTKDEADDEESDRRVRRRRGRRRRGRRRRGG